MIGLFTRHRTAANLLMVLMVLFGVLGLARMNVQFFPTFGVDWITISVNWPGASTEDVDDNIVAAIEPEVRFLDDVKRVVSQSVEGVGSVVIEFHAGTDLDTALANVENAVDRVETLPEALEKPVVACVYAYDTIETSSPRSPSAKRRCVLTPRTSGSDCWPQGSTRSICSAVGARRSGSRSARGACASSISP